jgi:hypothetical protein
MYNLVTKSILATEGTEGTEKRKEEEKKRRNEETK